jgi:superfamily I DNA/RNA helicase
MGKFKVNTSGSSREDKSFTNTKVEQKIRKPFVPTGEQEFAKDLAVKESICKIQACSGSGKTSELVYISSFLKVSSLYMTFNVTMARDAANKFKDHVACMTTHSLAYRKVGKGYQHKLSRPQGRYVNVALTGSEVARYFRLPDFELNSENDDAVIRKTFIGMLIKDTVDSYEMNAEEGIGREHLPYKQLKDLEKKYGKDFDKKSFNKLILRFAKKLWEERTDKYSEVCCKHNTYLKLYQLSKPDLSKEYEIIYLDEAQDLNPVTRSIVLAQQDKCKLIFVGDKFQQIYSWNGSVNALQSLDCKSAPLSKSFRFGTQIAELATLILDGDMEVLGNEGMDSVVGVDVVDYTKPHTFLFRTNMELIFTAVDLIKKGQNISVNIDMKDFVAMLKSADALFSDNMKAVKHENIVPYSTWEELVDESQTDRELGRLVSIVDDGNADQMINILHSHRNDSNSLITLTTAHKAKGLEYPQVCLASDFPSNYNRKGEFVGLTEEERNLLYVASTRAIDKLNINQTCQEFYNISGREVCSTNKVKVIGSPLGEQAGYELESVVQMEALRDDFSNHTMSQEEAFEHGFIDPLGRETDLADNTEERINSFDCAGIPVGVSLTHLQAGTSLEELGYHFSKAVGKSLSTYEDCYTEDGMLPLGNEKSPYNL